MKKTYNSPQRHREDKFATDRHRFSRISFKVEKIYPRFIRVYQWLKNSRKFSVFSVTRFIFILLCIFVCSIKAQAIELIPMGSIELMGGGAYSGGEASSFSGNLEAEGILGMQLSEKLSLLPKYKGCYEGASSVKRLETGKHLDQKNQDHILSLKLIDEIRPSLKGKLFTNYKKSLSVETEDESWGNGVYDYDQKGLGAEVEHRKAPLDMTLSFSQYTVHFPNYQSLASAFDTETVGLENVGKDTQNYKTTELLAEIEIELKPGLFLKPAYIYTHKMFLDQRLPTLTGIFGKEKRRDKIQEISLSLNGKRKVGFGISYDLLINNSNQNHYNAEKCQFLSNFYDYKEHTLNPSITFYLASTELSLSYSYIYKKYKDRPKQDTDGNYLEEKLYLKNHILNLCVSHPLTDRLFLKADASYKKSSSNMEYEDLYSYNYSSSNYLFGVSYEY